jgi:hypothetical protein
MRQLPSFMGNLFVTAKVRRAQRVFVFNLRCGINQKKFLCVLCALSEASGEYMFI